ncbi:MAG: DUF2914 domain-containing protein [Gammaproteobacteria bacterium]|nr:DUF2914 domain-containing protein [Gammaproteobacteria bacterium]
MYLRVTILFSVLGLALSVSAAPQPNQDVMETDPSVMVGSMPPAAAPRRLEPTRAPAPYQVIAPKPLTTVTKMTEVKRKVPANSPSPKTPIQPTVKQAQAQDGATGEVVRAQLTSAIHAREPVDQLDLTNVKQTQLYYFTEIKGMAGKFIMHRWEHQGQIKHEQRLQVGSARYRTYSRKTLNPHLVGEWKVSVLNSKGVVLNSSTFTFGRPDATAETP